MVKKIFEMEVDGKTVGFRFNMLCMAKACKIIGCSMDELFQKMGMVKGYEMDLEAAMNFFYAAAINYNEGKKKEIDFTVQDVSDWIDYFGLAKMSEMIKESFEAPEIKNQTAPKESGPESNLTT